MDGKSREWGSVSAQSSYDLFTPLAVIQHQSRAIYWAFLYGNCISIENPSQKFGRGNSKNRLRGVDFENLPFVGWTLVGQNLECFFSGVFDRKFFDREISTIRGGAVCHVTG